MANYTLTYSESNQGFPSFYSFIPEMTIGMNNFLYSYKGGNLFKHNVNALRNNFYGVQYDSMIKTVFNESPLVNFLYKVITLEGSHAWEVQLESDQQTGFIEKDWFEKKEGSWFAFVRNYSPTTDFLLRSVNGLGSVTSVDSTIPSATVLQFPLTFEIGSIISIGDVIYFGTTPTLGGTVTAVDKVLRTITIDTTIIGGNIPADGDFILYVKNGIAESHGVLGHYVEVTLTNDETSATELFMVRAEIMKSFP